MSNASEYAAMAEGREQVTASRRPFATAVPGTVADFRLEMLRAEQERVALRDSELEAQVSPAKNPRERIEVWERLHALRLPRASNHLLLAVIAKQTQLTLGQVHDEQARRAAVSDNKPHP